MMSVLFNNIARLLVYNMFKRIYIARAGYMPCNQVI